VNTRGVRRFAAVWRQRFRVGAGACQTTQAECRALRLSKSRSRRDGTTGHDVERMDRDPRHGYVNGKSIRKVSGYPSNELSRGAACTRATCCRDRPGRNAFSTKPCAGAQPSATPKARGRSNATPVAAAAIARVS